MAGISACSNYSASSSSSFPDSNCGSAANSIEIPLYIQFERFVTHLRWHATDSSRLLQESTRIHSGLAQRIHPHHLRSSNQSHGKARAL